MLLCAGIAGIPITSLHFAHSSMVLEWQLDTVFAAFLDCSHLLLIATTAFALQHVDSLHNAVHSSSLQSKASLCFKGLLSGTTVNEALKC